MAWLTDRMIRKFIRNHEKVTDQQVRLGYVRLECLVSIFGNFILGSIKWLIGLWSNSIALKADAFHTYGDMISSIVLLVSMRVAVSPPDKKHPHGHGRAEALGTLILSALLIATAIEFAHQSFHRLMSPQLLPRTAWVIPVLLVFWAFKEWMARFSIYLGSRASSDALKADGFHHRSDAWATLLVVMSFMGSYVGYPRLDAIFGFGVVGFIGWAGVSMAWAMMSRLLGEAPSNETIARIVAAAASVRGVRGVHSVEVHDYGNRHVASLHIEVSPNMKTGDSHNVATLVEEALSRRLDMSALVHIEVREGPRQNPRSAFVEETLKKLMQIEKGVLGFHAIHVISSDRQTAVDLHLNVVRGMPVEECHRIDHELAEILRGGIGAVKLNVHCEPAEADTEKR